MGFKINVFLTKRKTSRKETIMSFKENFIWGAASSSYQVEGAAYEDGKGLSIWDVYAKEPGKVYGEHNADTACDHYHRYKEDVALMKELGLKAYRFSINWPRILPNGIGPINPAGIQFYNNLIDELLKNNIEPYITLYHWELPYELHKKGGWLNEESIKWFGDYAKVIAEHFSDRVKYFFTFNEPQCFVGLGYLSGGHAPGLKCALRDTFQIAHNVMKAHGQAVIELRHHAKQKINIGYAPTGPFCYPETDSAVDIEAARRATFSCPDFDNWTWNISWFSDPVMLGKYPEEGLAKYEEFLPVITKEDLQLMHQPTDFYGQNLYHGQMVRHHKDKGFEQVKRYDGFPKTAIQWPVTQESLYWASKFLYERYKKPIYITENGLSCHDWVSVDGKVHDPNRIDYYHRYIQQLKKAVRDGVEVDGYFAWSIMDNFEWGNGYSDRFGLIYVDFLNQHRIIKDSGYWYKELIKTNGSTL